jgi:hypothetical protein
METTTKMAIVGATKEATISLIDLTRQSFAYPEDDLNLMLTIKTSEQGITDITLFAGNQPVRQTTITK